MAAPLCYAKSKENPYDSAAWHEHDTICSPVASERYHRSILLPYRKQLELNNIARVWLTGLEKPACLSSIKSTAGNKNRLLLANHQ